MFTKWKKFLSGLLAGLGLMSFPFGSSQAEAAGDKGTIVFVPIDNRPITDLYTADTFRKAGYEILVPPDEILGGAGHMKGDVDAVWQWLDNTMQKNYVKAAVLSGDTLIYGSLVGSRTHELKESQLLERVNKLKDFRDKYPDIQLYTFTSIMRTPHYSAKFGGAECEYMDTYAYHLYRYSALMDKQEMQGLKNKEKKELESLLDVIPADVLSNWQARRNKNVDVNKKLLDLTKEGYFDYFIIGHDDNAPLSQTHREARYLDNYVEKLGLGQDKIQNMSGADEIGALLLARAGNNLNYTLPFVYAEYSDGVGGEMVPSFSGQPIDTVMRQYIHCTGGYYTPNSEKADMALFVNTAADGKDFGAGNEKNVNVPNSNDKKLVNRVENFIDKGVPVTVVDIATYNGSSNSLMQCLENKNLLFKLNAYGGWNTASNSLGFAMSQAMQMPYISKAAKNELLMVRYLDDWGYQANVRQKLYPYLEDIVSAEDKVRLNYDTNKMIQLKQKELEEYGTKELRAFAAEHLSTYPNKQSIYMKLPWSRFFENLVILK